MCGRIVDTDTQKHRSTGAALCHFYDFTFAVKSHFMYTDVTAGLQTAAGFDRIGVNQTLAVNTHCCQSSDLAVRSNIKAGTQVTQQFQDPLMRIGLDRIVKLHTRQVLFQKAIVLFYLF